MTLRTQITKAINKYFELSHSQSIDSFLDEIMPLVEEKVNYVDSRTPEERANEPESITTTASAHPLEKGPEPESLREHEAKRRLYKAIEECIGIRGNKAYNGSYAAPREAFRKVLRDFLAEEIRLTESHNLIENAHPLEEGWEKEFEELFGDAGKLEDGMLRLWAEKAKEKIKQFFSQTLAQERKKYETRIEKLIDRGIELHKEGMEIGRQEERVKVVEAVKGLLGKRVEYITADKKLNTEFDIALNAVLALTDL